VIENYREVYGDVTLSYAVGEAAYCSPRKSGLPLAEYDSVEIALIVSGHESFLSPGAIGLAEFDALFDGMIAGRVQRADLDRLRGALAARAGVEVRDAERVEWGVALS